MTPINILMVDDQPAKLLTYESMLAQMGERLIKAGTASEALGHLLREDIAVVLMDVNMPELDGFELAAMIREHPRCKRTAIIFVSAVNISDMDRVKGYETGAVDYVSVPVVPEILRAKIGVFADLYRKTSQLEELNRTLEARVAARTQELEATVGELSEREHRLMLQGQALAEADRRKTVFLAMLAHELRNPLQPIRASLDVMRHAQASEEDSRWAREVIDRQSAQLVRLVDDLLDASRISSGKLELRTRVMDLAPVLATALEANRPLAQVKRHRVDLQLGQDAIHVRGDAVRLAQVFLNLLNNAVKYSPEGASTRVTASVSDGLARICIRDHGIGIAAADLPRVFDMFYQGDAGTDAPGGLGLGLALVRQLVELHGGEVSVSSPGLGGGSQFEVALPVTAHEDVAAEAPLPLAAAAVDRSCRRILVVDDNKDAAESLAIMLRMEGNEVDMAYDGEGALDAIASFRPDVVLMDLGMPRLDGYEAAHAIRRGPQGRDVVLVALTGWGGEEDRLRSRQAGFDRHLVKPVGPDEILALLGSLAGPSTH